MTQIMNEQGKKQNVVVIQDASREVSSATRRALTGLALNPGDELTLLGILHQVNNPSTFRKFMGYKSKVDSSMFGTNNKLVEKELEMKKHEYKSNAEIIELEKECVDGKIKFQTDVLTGPSPKLVALETAASLGATWVILDRQMKKDQKYFLDGLHCRISRMKRDNTIEKLRGPKVMRGSSKLPAVISEQITYDEMIPGSLNEELSPDKNLNPPDSSSSKEKESGQNSEYPSKNEEKNYAFRESTSSNQLPTNTLTSSSVSFQRSVSSDQLITSTFSSSSIANTEASSSSWAEAKRSPVGYQEGEYTTKTELETAEELSPSIVFEGRKLTRPETICNGIKQHQCGGDSTHGHKINNDIDHTICSLCHNKRPKSEWKKDFTFSELSAATEGFAQRNFLSEGGFGSVFRGRLKNGIKIAVKQHKSASLQGEKEFRAEVNVLRTARHQNVVMLLGSCSEGSHRLLVYEYVCNGSLDQHLSKHTQRPLSWVKRMKIALGAARGLKYLHENRIIHRDMRPNNILVNCDYEPILGDFGLARIQQDDQDHSSETRLVGTLGYLAPEYAESGKVSTKTDVYSFGVVLLQLITGLTTTDKRLGGKSLVGWARPQLKERNYPVLLDQRISDNHNVYQLFWMVRVAEKCLSKNPQKRLTMETVVLSLEHIMKEGNICTIKDFSSMRSESVSSVPESTPSQMAEDETNEGDISSPSILSISSWSQVSTLCTPSPVLYASKIQIPGRRSSISGRSQGNRIATPRRTILYDDMVG